MAGVIEGTMMIEVINHFSIQYNQSIHGLPTAREDTFYYQFGMDPDKKWVMHEFHYDRTNWIRSIIGVNEKDPFKCF